MKIYLSPSTAGSYGGLLNGRLRYLPHLIQDELDNSDFVSTFEKLWLTLSFPPMYVLPGVVGIEKRFFEHYEKLPYSRLNPKHKKIEMTLKAPEFSEHFQLTEKSNYQNQFKIDDKFKNISEIDLASILIDEYLEASDIIKNKIKKGDTFNSDSFTKTLLKIKNQISIDFLEKINIEQQVKERKERIEKAIRIREERSKSNKPKDKRVKDLRVYYDGFPNKTLYPYDYIYTEIFRNLLRRSNLLCPQYHHLYIQVAKTLEDGLLDSFAFEDWYVNGISILDYEAYLLKSEAEKEKVVVDIISQGLNDIATVDNLDKLEIQKVIDEVKSNGFNTELFFDKIENERYSLEISYLSKSREEECPIFFHLTDKKLNRSNKIQIGRADNSQIYFWLQNVAFSREKIKVKSSASIEASVYLKDKPKTMEFDIEGILNN